VDVVIQLVVLLVLVAIGWFAGRANEQRHFRELAEREKKLRQILVFNEKRPPADQTFARGVLVVGSVVIAEDYFKRIAAGLRGLVGGRIGVYESLLDRGRREAILRMKQEAGELGATMVFNVRLETASLSEERGGRSPMFSAEFIAYGTALVPARRA
jgi:uncharacterized protein YbjQ (UPF0145 family)